MVSYELTSKLPKITEEAKPEEVAKEIEEEKAKPSVSNVNAAEIEAKVAEMAKKLGIKVSGTGYD